MSKGKATAIKANNEDNEAPGYMIGGLRFRLISENELTGERWDASHYAIIKLDSASFKIAACKWQELTDICSAALVSCESDMSFEEIKDHISASKDLTLALLTSIVVRFTMSNGAWLGLLDDVSQAKTREIQEAIHEQMIIAKAQAKKTNGQAKSL